MFGGKRHLPSERSQAQAEVVESEYRGGRSGSAGPCQKG
jgi:hypothetical protein